MDILKYRWSHVSIRMFCLMLDTDIYIGLQKKGNTFKVGIIKNRFGTFYDLVQFGWIIKNTMVLVKTFFINCDDVQSVKNVSFFRYVLFMIKCSHEEVS